MALSSALAQEGVGRVSSYISTRLDDRASRAHIAERLEMAVSRLEYVLERTATLPIKHVSLLRRRRMFERAYNRGLHLLNKHNDLQAQDEEAGQVVVRSPSYYLVQRILRAATSPLSSLLGFNKELLSSSVVQTFEWHADWADKFLTLVESGCPPRRDITLRYPFARKLLQGKHLSYQKGKGSQKLSFRMSPLILEGHGVEAWLGYQYYDHERLDKSFSLVLLLRLSESTDIVGAAIDSLRSSASLLNLPAQDSIMSELTRLPNLQDISDSYAPPWVGFEVLYALVSKGFRPDPLCCQANGNGPSVKSTTSSELSHVFQGALFVLISVVTSQY